MNNLTVTEALNEIGSNPSHFSISAEAYGVYNKKSSFNPIFIEKDKITYERLRKRLSGKWLFESVQSEDKDTLVNAMREEIYHKGDVVIKQGDLGDRLFIVEKGIFNCYMDKNNEPSVLLKVYEEGEMFGELALIYNCPRTATMIADSDYCTVFSLERETFNHIVNFNTIKRNEERLKMLANVPILKTLGQYERSKILDACRHVEFDQGEYVIIEGEPGEEFYILLEGKAHATKLLDDSLSPQRVKDYKAGDYFGERALLKDTTRDANIVADTHIKCLMLSRDDFKKLLGPIEDILKRNMKIYINYID